MFVFFKVAFLHTSFVALGVAPNTVVIESKLTRAYKKGKESLKVAGKRKQSQKTRKLRIWRLAGKPQRNTGTGGG